MALILLKRPKEEKNLNQIIDALKLLYDGEYGSIEYRFSHDNGIGRSVKIYSSLLGKTVDITDHDSW